MPIPYFVGGIDDRVATLERLVNELTVDVDRLQRRSFDWSPAPLGVAMHVGSATTDDGPPFGWVIKGSTLFDLVRNGTTPMTIAGVGSTTLWDLGALDTGKKVPGGFEVYAAWIKGSSGALGKYALIVPFVCPVDA